jgi:hydrogenase nickel incorporation protein HypA/HybF
VHELGVVIEIAKTVERIAKEQQLTKVDTIVLQIGELSSMVPKYIMDCFPAAIDGTILSDTKLKIEVLPANALCLSCQQVFNVLQHQQQCPKCHSGQWDLLSGKEFMIKEIVAW